MLSLTVSSISDAIFMEYAYPVWGIPCIYTSVESKALHLNNILHLTDINV